MVHFDMASAEGCGLRPDGEAHCWYADGHDGPETSPGPFVDIGASSNLYCGLRMDGSAACWGFGVDTAPAPDAQFIDLEGKGPAMCGVKADGDVTCWGNGEFPSGVEGDWTKVTVGWNHGCAWSEAGHACFGTPEHGPTEAIEEGIRVMAAGFRHTCAVRLDGHIECWGVDPEAISPP